MRVLAIDIGTASVSAALAEARSAKSAVLNSWTILKVFRYPFNLIDVEDANQIRHRPAYAVKNVLEKVFHDVFSIHSRLDRISISLSDPFFVDVSASRRFDRPDHGKMISAGEIAADLKYLRDEASGGHRTLRVCGEDVLAMRINGYNVKNAAGFRGKSLEISAIFTLLNPSLQNHIDAIKDKFFPQSKIVYFSDVRTIRRALLNSQNLSFPILVIDAGGELTGVFRLDEDSIGHSTAPFGVGTIERRIASALKVSRAEAESMLKVYSAGTLHRAESNKIDKILSQSVSDWWGAVEEALGTLSSKTMPRQIFLSGGGSSLDALLKQVKEGLKKVYNADMAPQAFLADSFKDFFLPPGVLTGGGDVILASLLLFATWQI